MQDSMKAMINTFRISPCSQCTYLKDTPTELEDIEKGVILDRIAKQK
jgi:hypothetical protein